MGQQDYDFFATGAVPPAPPEPPPAARTQRGPRQFTDPSGRAVNQFGTPIDVGATPAGPAAAPGYGAQAYHGEGLATRGVGWEPPPAHTTPYPVSTHAAPPLPGAYAQASQRPGPVLAAGIIGIVQGAVGVVVGLLALLAVFALAGAVASAGAGSMAGLGLVMAVVVFLVLVVAAGYLVAGIGLVRGKRWAWWTLLVLESLGLVLGLLGGDGHAGGDVGRLVDLLVPVAVIVLLVLPPSRAWLKGRD